VQPPTSVAPHADGRPAEAGFTLLEVVSVLAILAMVAGLALAAIPRATSRPRLESYAVAIAALLKADRNAALRDGSAIATHVDAATRTISSGATGRQVRVPDDVAVNALLTVRCDRQGAASTIRFFASGVSCGGVIGLRRADFGYDIRVNWLTGGVEIAPFHRT